MLPDILICDDSEMARKQMARALPTALRHQVSFCRNGSEALAHIRNNVPDLLFLNLNMPDLDGYEVLAHLRSEQIELLTIVVSGDIQPGYFRAPADTESGFYCQFRTAHDHRRGG